VLVLREPLVSHETQVNAMFSDELRCGTDGISLQLLSSVVGNIYKDKIYVSIILLVW
jgi:hypothetical protein